ncbi:hypothetical protein P3W85_12720 [Cupriavidus basilensis]|uniref:Uncharacterized protein n=1 Tax=Cupriavidus basilensis TaxID=68895 RepID=A0ABT6AMF9_9BURK|nr:hypothetical protein [Cupriavidus basilensis]MDF3833804.1 hypothetical protein [Cupriavidus basilensis]
MGAAGPHARTRHRYDILLADDEIICGFGKTVALRNIERMESRGFVAHAAAVGEMFQARLRVFADHPLIGEARGVGLIGALEPVASKATRESFPPGVARPPCQHGKLCG